MTYEVARCNNCGCYYVTWVRTALHGDVSLPMECPRCGSDDYELLYLTEQEVESIDIVVVRR
jgi:Zn finger protein HypA/HybF involved in hydrogenase expression